MNNETLKKILTDLREARITVDQAVDALRHLPFQDLGFACIDHHRGIRRGVSEVIFGEGKEIEEILAIMERMMEQGDDILITRLSVPKAQKIREVYPHAEYHERARSLVIHQRPVKVAGRGPITVICAGTSDIPVAEEAAITARFMGNEVYTAYDIGVSGLHRIMAHKDKIDTATVLIVVAGMEGALPSVVAGLVDKPVIAVPTSVGYGASFQGIAALLSMLNSCASGVVVVNIDNGFGAGYAASLINKRD